MAEREGKLTIKTQLDGMDAAAEQTSHFADTIERAGDVGAEGAAQLQQVTSATNELASAETVAGEAAQASGRSMSEAAQAVSAAAKAAIEAWMANTTAAEESGVRSSAATLEISQSFEALAGELRASGNSLEVQRIGLNAIQRELETLTADYVKAGAAGAEQANISGEALTRVRAMTADVSAEIREQVNAYRQQGEAAQVAAETATTANDSVRASLENLRGETVTVEDATKIAADRIRDAWSTYNEELKITPRQIGFVVQAVEGLRQTIIETRGSIDQATEAEIADYRALEAELVNLQQRGRILQDQQKDAQLLLRETGGQIQQVGIAIQQVTQNLGPGGQAIGHVAGEVALLSGGVNQLKDVVEQLKLGTLSAEAGGLTVAIQAAAVAVTAAAATYAGLKISETVEQDAISFEDLKQKALGAAGAMKGELKDAAAGVQLEFQNIIADLINVRQSLNAYVTDSALAGKSTRDLGHDVEGLGVALLEGRNGVELFQDALTNGFTRAQAYKLALVEGTDVQELYNEAVHAGTEGQKVLADAFAKSEGDAGKFSEALRSQKTYLDQLTASTSEHTRAVQAEAAAAIAAANATANAQRQHQELTSTYHGTNVAINDLIASIGKYIAQGSQYKPLLEAEAAELQKILDAAFGLTQKERERIQVVIDLAKNAENLTKAEQAYVKSLADQIVSEKAATESAKARLATVQGLAGAFDDLNAAIDQETKAAATNKTAIQSAAEAAQKALDANLNLTSAERERYQEIIILSKQIDELTTQQKKLNDTNKESTETAQKQNEVQRETLSNLAEQIRSAREATIQNSDLAASTEKVYTVVGASAKTLEEEIGRKKLLIEYLQKSTNENQNFVTSQEKVTTSVENGKVTISNISEAQKQLEENISKSAKASRDAAEATTIQIKATEDGRTVITNAAAATSDAASKTNDLRDAAKGVGDEAEAAKAKIAAHVETLKHLQEQAGPTADSMGQLVSQVRSLADEVERVNQHLKEMPGNIDKAAASAKAAAAPSSSSGGSNAYPGVTEE